MAFTLNAVISQRVLRRALNELGTPETLSGMPRFIDSAALSPWIYASVSLQVLGYVMWMLIVSREKLGVATASIGGGFYTLMALSALARLRRDTLCAAMGGHRHGFDGSNLHQPWRRG